ncbi:hypothetical protein BGZ65_002918 [Modicella reniformis]|uniref:Uncharacterized protein n=1 Tax=Modicella reniformis TaxID=1440133 RepID=A0A9P6IL56_9FUNG|nr:hypothetical protein BGZ65_002918 [Modicella reniformis]
MSDRSLGSSGAVNTSFFGSSESKTNDHSRTDIVDISTTRTTSSPTQPLRLRRKDLPPLSLQLPWRTNDNDSTIEQQQGHSNSTSRTKAFEKAFGFERSSRKSPRDTESASIVGLDKQQIRGLNNGRESVKASKVRDPKKHTADPPSSSTLINTGIQRSKPSLRKKVLQAVKQTLQGVWPRDMVENKEVKCRWVYNHEAEKSLDSPFFNVQYGVRFHEIVPKPPPQFPYPPQIMYSSPYGCSLVPASRPQGSCGESSVATREEARLRERTNRKALVKLKARGQFRRRTNIKLDNVEGRQSTEAVEVARIRRMYSQKKSSSSTSNDDEKKCDSGADKRKEERTEETLLKKVNRQARSGMVEWSLVNVEPSDAIVNLTLKDTVVTTVGEPAVVKCPLTLGQARFSRRSQRKTMSTRIHKRPTRQDHVVEAQSTTGSSIDTDFASGCSLEKAKKTIPALVITIYSSMSEDWNRPLYYARSKSRRYPVSLQTKIREPPLHANLRVLIKSELVSTMVTDSQLSCVACHVKARGIRNLDGSIIHPVRGDELHEIGYRVVLEEIKNGSGAEQDINAVSAFGSECKTAKPTGKDALGFIEYDNNNNNNNHNRTRADDLVVNTSAQKHILDVNDISLLVASLCMDPYHMLVV